MKNKKAYISADISEEWAGYLAILIDGDEEREIPCRTREDAQEYVDKFLLEGLDTEDGKV